jgi:predicted nucleotide-binding protein
MSLRIHPGTLKSLADIVGGFYSDFQLKGLFRALGLRYRELPNMRREDLALDGLRGVDSLAALEMILAPIADKRNYGGSLRRHELIFDKLSQVLQLDGYDIRFDGLEPKLVTIENESAAAPGPPVASKTAHVGGTHGSSGARSNKVFVVHGRDRRFESAMSDFLRSLGLEVVSWMEAVRLTGKPTPYLNEVIEAALGVAQAIVILMTPDNEGRLRQDLWDQNTSEAEKEYKYYPRQNVVYEAGMAFGLARNRTIIVKSRDVVVATDLEGLNYQAFNGDADSRNQLASRLEIAGCTVSRTGDWLHSGSFPDFATLGPQSLTTVQPSRVAPPPSEAELTRRFSVQPTLLLSVGGSFSGPDGFFLAGDIANVGRGVARDVRLKLPELAAARVAPHISVGGKLQLRYRYDDKPCFRALLNDNVVAVEFEDELGTLYRQTGEVVQDLTSGGVIYSYSVPTIGPPTPILARSIEA